MSLHTCVLFTAIRLESGNVFWWGVLPFNQRKKIMEKFANKKSLSDRIGGFGSARAGSSSARKHRATNSSLRPPVLIPLGGNSDIEVGSQVYMRKAPIYHSGSIGFTVAGNLLFRLTLDSNHLNTELSKTGRFYVRFSNGTLA